MNDPQKQQLFRNKDQASQEISQNDVLSEKNTQDSHNKEAWINKKKIQVFSQAYPSFQEVDPPYKIIKQRSPEDNSVRQKKIILQPEVKSQIHQILLHINFNAESHSEPIVIRPFEINDLPQLKKLQDEWFPIRYTDEFYKKIIRKSCYCLVAETTIKIPEKEQQAQTYQKILVAATVFQLTDSSGYAYKPWKEAFLNWFWASEDSIYIMTLGVIDEFRKKGVGKMLIESITQVANQWKCVKLIFLHVISYNRAAIYFYTKNGFRMLEDLNNFYHVGGKQYGGQAYGIFVNGGAANSKWSQWFRKLFR